MDAERMSVGQRVRRVLWMLILAGLGSAALGVGAAQVQQPAVVFKIATIAPEGSTWMKLMIELDRRVREETGGAVGFRFYPGGQQGSDLDALRKIRSGQIQGAGLTGVGLGEIEPSLRIFELPFMFRTNEEIDAGHRMLDPIFTERLRGRGFQLLGWADVGFVYLFSQTPVRSVSDLRAQKTWLWEGDPLAEALLDELGVSPVPLNITDVLTSLQTGIVNTVYVTPYACLSLQWFSRLKCMTDARITNGMGAVIVSTAAYDRLSAEQKAIVERICSDVFTRLIAATRQQNDEAAAAILERSITRIEPDASAMIEFEAIGRKVWDRLAGTLYERELLEKLTAAVTAARQGAGAQP